MMYPFTNLTDRSKSADALLQWMEAAFADFPPIKAAYDAAMAALEEQLGTDAVEQESQAIAEQTRSDLLFCLWLGFTANLDHFRDPVARCFMDVDFEVFLQEHVAHSLPDYAAAQDARNRFYAGLDDARRSIYEAVITYTTYLDTTVPKLAHYFGYLLGNELLPRLVPDYQPDTRQTLAYCRMLEDFLDQTRLPTAL